MKKILLMDGHSILNRAFYGVPDLTNSKGMHTNAVYGFINILLKVIDEEQPDFVTVAFDVKQPTFRHERYEAYKGTRKPMPAELHEQVPVVKDVLKAMNITVVERGGYEADDILGTIAGMAEREGFVVTIVSGDRDLLQLVTDKVTLRIPKTKGGKTVVEDYTPDRVKEVYSLSPKQIIDLKGLMGDSSDNIPGLPGVGEKTATKLLLQYGTVEEVLSHAQEITPNKAKNAVIEHGELAVLSKELATIKTDCELDYSLEDAGIDDMFNEKAYIIIKELEFKSMLERFETDRVSDDDKAIEYEVINDCEIFNKKIDSIIKDCKEKRSKGHRDSEIAYKEQDGEADNRNNIKAACHIIKDEHGIPVAAAIMWSDGCTPIVVTNFGCDVNGYNPGDKYAAFSNAIRKICDSGITFIMHDVKENLDILGLGFSENITDMRIAAYLLNPIKDSYDADDIARDYLGKQIQSYAERFGRKKVSQIVAENVRDLYEYAVITCGVMWNAYDKICSGLADAGMDRLYRDIEMPLAFALYDMEKTGIRANKEALLEYGESLVSRIEELEKAIYERAGERFNINSPKQLGIILFEKLKLPFAKKTKTGYSTSADILDKLRLEDPIVPAVLEYRQLTKLKSTYADGLAEYIADDGRIHGHFNQTITATGRISSTEPNLQNIPVRIELGRQIRKVFVPAEGCIFLDADYSQIELRVLAHMSGDESLIQAYNEGRDIHSITAAKVFHVPLEEVTSDLRRKAKAVNFGIVYGISSFGLGQDLGIGKKEAEGYIRRYFETYPSVKIFLDNLVTEAKKNGYSKTLYGRRRPIPELSSSNFMQRSFGERVAMNAPIQGTAADIIKIAMINVDRKLEEEGLESRIILQVHDELLLEVPLAEEERAAKILREEMMNAADMAVKLLVEVERGHDWYEAK